MLGRSGEAATRFRHCGPDERESDQRTLPRTIRKKQRRVPLCLATMCVQVDGLSAHVHLVQPPSLPRAIPLSSASIR